jgi:hypothetical protein
MKRMLLAILLTALPVCSALGQNDPNRQTIAFSDPSKPGTLSVETGSGSVTIKGYDGKVVTVESTGTAGLTALTPQPKASTDPGEIKGLRRIDSYGRNIAVDQANNTVTIRSGWNATADLLIQVPVRTNIRVNGSGSGHIFNLVFSGNNTVYAGNRTNPTHAKTTIEGVDGEIEVNAMNDVVLTDVSGSVLVNSSNGKVTASLRRVTPEKPMSFVAVNGNIDVTLPPAVKASVRARTLDGEIYTGFEANEFSLQPFTTSGADSPFIYRTWSTSRSLTEQIQAEAQADSAARGRSGTSVFVTPRIVTASPFHFESDRSAAGNLNGGGPDFEFRTLHGNIYIRKGK